MFLTDTPTTNPSISSALFTSARSAHTMDLFPPVYLLGVYFLFISNANFYAKQNNNSN
jgi:hypothetical protein